MKAGSDNRADQRTGIETTQGAVYSSSSVGSAADDAPGAALSPAGATEAGGAGEAGAPEAPPPVGEVHPMTMALRAIRPASAR